MVFKSGSNMVFKPGSIMVVKSSANMVFKSSYRIGSKGTGTSLKSLQSFQTLVIIKLMCGLCSMSCKL